MLTTASASGSCNGGRTEAAGQRRWRSSASVAREDDEGWRSSASVAREDDEAVAVVGFGGGEDDGEGFGLWRRWRDLALGGRKERSGAFNTPPLTPVRGRNRC